jgi:hypothetical protein
MKATNSARVARALACCSAGLFLALVATASPAAADPADPTVPPVPVNTVPAPEAPNVQAAGTDASPPPPPQGVPHLASPDALPPGATMDPSVMGDESPNVSYLKDIWQAVQNHEISGKEALLLGISQRGMNTPYPDQAPGPNVPTSPGDPRPQPAPAVPAPQPAPAVPAPPTP